MERTRGLGGWQDEAWDERTPVPLKERAVQLWGQRLQGRQVRLRLDARRVVGMLRTAR